MARTSSVYPTIATADPSFLLGAPGVFPRWGSLAGPADTHSHQRMMDLDLEPGAEVAPDVSDAVLLTCVGKKLTLGRVHTAEVANHPSSSHTIPSFMKNELGQKTSSLSPVRSTG